MNSWKRKSNGPADVASGVTDKRRSDREPHSVSAAFGGLALELASSVGKTKQDLMSAAGMSVSTINRLIRGQGSPFAAIQIKKILRGWGADVSTLPPVYEDEDASVPMDERLREGTELLRRLWQLATDEHFEETIVDLRDDVRVHERAHELIAAGTGEHKRKKP